MKEVYTAKRIYSNYFNFIFKKYKTSYLLAGLIGFAFVLSAPIYILRVVGLWLSGKGELLNYSEFIYVGNIYVGLLVFGFLFFVLVSYTMWKQKFYLEDGKIIDIFPVRRVFSIRDIEKIILVSQNMGHILIKHAGDSLYTVCYWQGSSEQEWKSLLHALSASDPSIKDKIFFSNKTWGAPNQVPSSINESYSDVMKKSKHSHTTNNHSTGAEKADAKDASGRTPLIQKILLILFFAILLNIILIIFKK